MALSIKSEQADRLARELARVTGESITEAVTRAIDERLRRERRSTEAVARRLRLLSEEAGRLPLLDDRPEDDVFGYDDDGLPA
ncbi:MAG: type II toxin-antitoxin system VapB family antitoxin [Actinomycetota bacterium]